jgi:hypothetical protein
MKTTVDISDALLAQAKDLAHRRGCTLRSVIEEGLHQVLKQDEARGGFTLRDASVAGGWLTDEARGRTMMELIHGTYDQEQA